MEIIYLTQLKENPWKNKAANEGLSMEQIRDLRDKFNDGNPFPKAFEEYLYLAGAYNNIGYDDPGTLEALQEEVKVALESYGKTVDRPYFAFDMVDWNFMMILLDEDAEDPKVYVCEPGLAKRTGSPVLRDVEFTLSENINERIRRIKDGTF